MTDPDIASDEPLQAALTNATRGCLIAAVGWSLVIVVLSATVPIITVNTGKPGVQPRHTLLGENGPPVLLLAAIPLLISLCTWALTLAADRGHGASLTVAWVLVIALAVTAAVGTVTILIGIVVVPTAVLLITAVAVRPRRQGWRLPSNARAS